MKLPAMLCCFAGLVVARPAKDPPYEHSRPKELTKRQFPEFSGFAGFPGFGNPDFPQIGGNRPGAQIEPWGPNLRPSAFAEPDGSSSSGQPSSTRPAGRRPSPSPRASTTAQNPSSTSSTAAPQSVISPILTAVATTPAAKAASEPFELSFGQGPLDEATSALSAGTATKLSTIVPLATAISATALFTKFSPTSAASTTKLSTTISVPTAISATKASTSVTATSAISSTRLSIGNTATAASPTTKLPKSPKSSSTPSAAISPATPSFPRITPSGTSTSDGPKRWDAKIKTYSFQIILNAVPDIKRDARSVTPDVDVYDIDLFMTSKDVIQSLRRMNKTVICYFSAGTYEPGRPDSKKFASADQGLRLREWPSEKWLRFGNANVRRIMADRIQLASQKGCDALDPDNTDAYDTTLAGATGITRAETIDYIKYLSETAKKYGLAIGLKNSMAIINAVSQNIDFAVNEQCMSKKECKEYSSFRKPIFHIEYPPGLSRSSLSDVTRRRYCVDSVTELSQYFHTVLKPKNLDGTVQYCDGKYAKTPTRDPDGTGGRSRGRFSDQASLGEIKMDGRQERPEPDLTWDAIDPYGSSKSWQYDQEAIELQAELASEDGYPFAPGQGSENVIPDSSLFS